MGGTNWATGQTGSAAGLDGLDDFVQVGAQSVLTMTSAVTLSAWVYPTGPGSNSNYGGTILGKEGEYLINRAANGSIQWAFSNSNPGWAWINTGAVAPLNQWTHVAVTYDSGLIKTYLNGVLVHTFSGTGSIVDYDGGAYNDFRIGGRQESVQHFQGRIDEVRAYNRPLAASEISALINTQPSGLIGSWNFDEGAGSTTVDASGKGFHGTLMSGATWATGHSNSAASFDGINDYVQVGAAAGLSITNAASFSAWIFPTGTGSNSTYGGTIVGKEGEYLINRAANGNIQWAFSNSNPGWAWVNTGGVAPLNQWTHVAVVYDAGVIKTYINGSLVHTFNGQGAITDYDGGAYNDFRIGGRQESAQHFQGRIDEVRVWNRALSASEITAVQASAATTVDNNTGETPVPRNTASANAEILWLVADQLGTPRMIFDKTGSLSNMKRHDYLPFGEELSAGVGQRSASQGYGSTDGLRQKFTSKERDGESGLDYFMARHYQNAHGRFVSPDPLLASGRPAVPQSWNRYTYVLNNPLKFVDPNGTEEREDTLPGQTAQQPATQPPAQQPTPAPAPISPPQDLVASIMNALSQVTFTLNGQEGTGVMQLDQKINDQIMGALNETFARGVETGALTSATNGLVVPTTVGTQAAVGLSANVSGMGGAVGPNLTKTAQQSYEVAAGRAISADINNRAANGQTVSRVASQLEGSRVTINTTSGSIPGRVSRDVWRQSISSAVNRVYQAGIAEGMPNVGPPQVSPKNPF
jgi:RHS repeat-associated protein